MGEFQRTLIHKVGSIDGQYKRTRTTEYPLHLLRTSAAFLQLPELRGFWPMSAISAAGAAFDQSGNGRTLTLAGNPLYNVDGLAPYIDLDGTGDYLTRASEAGLNIGGQEAYVATAIQGMTLGGWFWIDTFVNADGLMTKFDIVGVAGSYFLDIITLPNRAVFLVNVTGVFAQVASQTITAGRWHFIVGRYTQDSDVTIFVNDIFATPVATAVGFPILAAAQPFNIGTFNNNAGGNDLDGRASMCFLCAAAFPDATIRALYNQTRSLFGV